MLDKIAKDRPVNQGAERSLLVTFNVVLSLFISVLLGLLYCYYIMFGDDEQMDARDVLIWYWTYVQFFVFSSKFIPLKVNIPRYLIVFITLRHCLQGEMLLVCFFDSMRVFFSLILHSQPENIRHTVLSQLHVFDQLHAYFCWISGIRYPNLLFSIYMLFPGTLHYILRTILEPLFGTWITFFFVSLVQIALAFFAIVLKINLVNSHTNVWIVEEDNQEQIQELEQDPQLEPVPEELEPEPEEIIPPSPAYCQRISTQEFDRESKDYTKEQVDKLYKHYHENKNLYKHEGWEEKFSVEHHKLLSGLVNAMNVVNDPLGILSQPKNIPVCVICQENPRDVCILPCKHLVLCKECVQNYQKHAASCNQVYTKCPICRAKVDKVIQVYF